MLNLSPLFEQTIILGRNDFLLQKGALNDDIFFIEKGSLKIFIVNNNEEQIIRLAYKNNLISAIDTFLTNKPTDFYIQAIKETTIKVISKKSFMDFVNESKENKEVYIKMMEDLIIQQLEREKDLLTPTSLERYQRVFKRSPQLFQEIPNKYIANYLRMSPETLSRLRKS